MTGVKMFYSRRHVSNGPLWEVRLWVACEGVECVVICNAKPCIERSDMAMRCAAEVDVLWIARKGGTADSAEQRAWKGSIPVSSDGDDVMRQGRSVERPAIVLMDSALCAALLHLDEG